MAARSENTKPELTVGVALIKLLEQYQVEHVFGIPGVHTIELYRGLAASAIQHHTPRHEQGAGFMADGYARVSGKAGVCFVISGPGLTNITTPMGQALADSIPMLVISSVNDTLNTPHARGMLHEMPDQLSLSSGVTRFSHTINDAEELPQALARAFAQFSSARPGPVHLQLPVSLLGSAADENLTRHINPLVMGPAPQPAVIETAVALLNKSKRPLILAGGGARHSSNELQLLATTLDAPVHLTINARGILPFKHELAVPATCTLPSVRQAVLESDVVLALGTELAATDYDQYKNDGFSIEANLIRCDIDAAQLNNNFMADIGIAADCKTTISALQQQLTGGADRKGSVRAAQIMNAAYAELTTEMKQHLQLLEEIRDRLPNCIFVGDSTQVIYSGNMIFNTAKPQQWFNSSTGFGTLGYALPAATGAAIAANNKPVVCLIGDGGLQFVLGELGALKDTGLPVAIVVWCNNGYREIKTSMENADVSTVGVEFTVPDFVAVANAYGIKGKQASSASNLCEEIERSHDSGESVLIAVNEDEIMC